MVYTAPMRTARLLTAALLALYAAPAHAHPHEWIDVQVTLIFNAQKQITAMRQTWLFDDYYTALSLPDFDANHNGKWDTDELAKLAHDNVANLKDFNYFTRLDTKEPASFMAAVDVTSTMPGQRIAMRFTLPLAQPYDPAASFGYRIYDPSYYVAMLSAKQNPVRFENADGMDCSFAIDKPNPSATWVGLAAGLDKNAVAPDDLGRYFAEHVSITCR